MTRLETKSCARWRRYPIAKAKRAARLLALVARIILASVDLVQEQLEEMDQSPVIFRLIAAHNCQSQPERDLRSRLRGRLAETQ